MNASTILPVADELVSLVDLAREFAIPYQTLVSWKRIGVAGHKLKVFRRGRLLYTRPSWLAEFVEKTNRDA